MKAIECKVCGNYPNLHLIETVEGETLVEVYCKRCKVSFYGKTNNEAKKKWNAYNESDE